jgi:hypothetical protein
VTAGSSGHANSPHPSSCEGHHSTTWWSSSFLLLGLITHCFYAAAASLVQRNSVPFPDSDQTLQPGEMTRWAVAEVTTEALSNVCSMPSNVLLLSGSSGGAAGMMRASHEIRLAAPKIPLSGPSVA